MNLWEKKGLLRSATNKHENPQLPVEWSRPIQEFHYGGEFHPPLNPADLNDVDWGQEVHHRHGEPGVKREWWYHTASGTWFIAERDNLQDHVIQTYLYTPECGND